MARTKKYTLQSLIVCDDVRQERTGKDILIGVYSDAIIFPSFPAGLSKLILRIAFIMHVPAALQAGFAVIDSAGVQRGSGSGSLPAGPADRLVTIAFEIRNIVFQEPTTLTFHFGVGGKPAPIGSIQVRAVETEEERARIPKRK